MPFTETETESILKQLEEEFWAHHRPPLDLRDKVREGQRIDGQSIELFSEPTRLPKSGRMDRGTDRQDPLLSVTGRVGPLLAAGRPQVAPL